MARHDSSWQTSQLTEQLQRRGEDGSMGTYRSSDLRTQLIKHGTSQNCLASRKTDCVKFVASARTRWWRAREREREREKGRVNHKQLSQSASGKAALHSIRTDCQGQIKSNRRHSSLRNITISGRALNFLLDDCNSLSSPLLSSLPSDRGRTKMYRQEHFTWDVSIQSGVSRQPPRLSSSSSSFPSHPLIHPFIRPSPWHQISRAISLPSCFNYAVSSTTILR